MELAMLSPKTKVRDAEIAFDNVRNAIRNCWMTMGE